MNELKPEDVMRALDILDKMDFFQGQRAGRELWFEKPFEVQEQDIADFSQGIAFLKNLIADADALALIREKDAEIEHLKMREKVLTQMLDDGYNEWEDYVRADAITEFAEMLCEGRLDNDPVVIAVEVAVKEMREDQE